MAVTVQAACYMCRSCCCSRRAVLISNIWNVHLAVDQHGRLLSLLFQESMTFDLSRVHDRSRTEKYSWLLRQVRA